MSALLNLKAGYRAALQAMVEEGQWEDAAAMCVKLLIVEAEIRRMGEQDE